MKVGRRLAIKLLNASKFALSFGGDPDGEVHEPIDSAMLADLAALVDDATAAFEGFDYARALERTEAFFWWFCDDYLELVKARAYGVPGSGDPAVLGSVGSALAVIRKAKSEAKVGMRAEVPSMTLVGPDAVHAHVRSAEGDLRAAGKLTGILEYAAGDEVAARDIELVAVPKPTA
jgi:valyl-tRNA synthetase